MRYLNKIIFINSATIHYAEVRVDGNVHFIGTQGVGKSTILRSILFFYNADTQKLGIPVEKKNYTDYYYQYSDSYIVYEITRETGNFCVLSFKSMNRICYRFIDSEYKKELFIGEDNAAYDSWEKIRASLDKNKIHYSNNINTYDEYRNILYGNAQGRKDYRKYSLMESKQFQNIPRTIQNVLLNSKLEAEFIKQTIISSLNEEEVNIDLNRYKTHLFNFETQLKDIEEFQNPTTGKLAERISQLSMDINYAEKSIIAGCKELFVAHEKVLKELPLLHEKQKKSEEAKSTVLQRKTDIENKSKQKCAKLEGDLAVCKNQLSVARKKEESYAEKGIAQIIERVNKRQEKRDQKKGLNEERTILTVQFRDVTTKYDALINNIENQFQAFNNEKQNQKLDLGNLFNNQKEKMRVDYMKQTDEFRLNMECELERLRENKNRIQEELNELGFRQREWKNEQLFQKEITAIRNRLIESEPFMQKIKNNVEAANLRIEKIIDQWHKELEKKENEANSSRNILKEQINELRNQIEKISSYIENSKNSFYGWLNNNVDGWEETIGKVCNDSVLHQSNLAPLRMDSSADSLFGVKIELNEIDCQVKTIEDYLQEKEESEQKIVECTNKTAKLTDLFEADKEKLRKKYQPQIREQKEQIRQLEYEWELTNRAIQNDKLELTDWQKRATEEQQKRLAELSQRMEDVSIRLQIAIKELSDCNERKEKDLTAHKNDLARKIKVLDKENEEKQKVLAEEINAERTKLLSQKSIYEQEKQANLKEQGADTNRLQTIDSQLAILTAELTFIEENLALVTEYKKDKRELLDKVPEIKSQKKQLEEKLQEENLRLIQELKVIQEKFFKINAEIKETENNLRSSDENSEEYNKISALDWYDNMQSYFSTNACAKVKTEKSCKELIGEITRIVMNKSRKMGDLHKEANEFMGNFSEDNIFAFKTKLSDDKEYMIFARELRDFMEEHKIEEYIKRVNERNSDIFKQVSNDTTELTSREGSILSVITKINNDFVARNFVGIIQRIEMRMDSSSNKVVGILKEIKKFNDEHGFDIGISNLFSSGNEDQIKQKAIGLLQELIKVMNAYRSDRITLSDSFELKFRVVENQNDTGFVERLSSVGSEGTDILVKAMINIMLLNVFKEGASRKFKDFKLHCVMDEIGKLHPNNIAGILKFANDRNILLINGSPTEQNALAYKHIYKLEKNAESSTQIKRILSQA